MTFRTALAAASGVAPERLPAGHQTIGSVVLLRFPEGTAMVEKERAAHAVMKLYPRLTTVCEIGKINGEYRTPHVKTLAGNGTMTVHREHGIAYELNVASIMFSKGNIAERARLVPAVKKSETVVDMFAGIGYFSLGIAKHACPENVIAIEKNPAAFGFLVRNIERNNISNVTAIHADCREAAPSLANTADRIIMGYFPGTERFLASALTMAKPRAVIHFHNTYPIASLPAKAEQDIVGACRAHKAGFRIIDRRVVKSYAPGVAHVVLDIAVRKGAGRARKTRRT